MDDKNDRSRKSEDIERKCYINDKNGRREQNLVIIFDDKMQFFVQKKLHLIVDTEHFKLNLN